MDRLSGMMNCAYYIDSFMAPELPAGSRRYMRARRPRSQFFVPPYNREGLLFFARKVRFFIPMDHVIVDKIDFANKKIGEGAKIEETDDADIKQDFIGVDIGQMTLQRVAPVIMESKAILWNGPMGVFEIDEFSKGTIEIAKLVAQATDKGAVTVIGGGDSISAVKKAGVDKKMTHISNDSKTQKAF